MQMAEQSTFRLVLVKDRQVWEYASRFLQECFFEFLDHLSQCVLCVISLGFEQHHFILDAIYRPQAKFGARLCFYTCLFVHAGKGVCLWWRRSASWGRDLHPGRVGQNSTHPHETREAAVCVLLECFLVKVISTLYFNDVANVH